MAYEFLLEEQIIPFTESILRVFDRYGERLRRQKARLKFLLAEIGLEELLKLADQELPALKSEEFVINTDKEHIPILPERLVQNNIIVEDPDKFNRWEATNTFEQKQKG